MGREQNLEMQRNGTQPSARGVSRGVYRSTSADDATRLLGRLTQQSSSNARTQAAGKTGIYRQQSSDASQATSGQRQRAATLGNLSDWDAVARRNPGPGSSPTAPPGQSSAQQQL